MTTTIQLPKIKSKLKNESIPGAIWPVEKANEWYARYKWLTGVNYIPATAINQLEMWQADTFDPQTITKELGWAQSLGFNTLRVFLHSVVWKQDAEGFKKRINQFLDIADRHDIKTMFVFFDDCWNKEPKPGIQPAPKVGVHNSGWMQDPGQTASFDKTIYADLEKYVKDILVHFADDERILLWDLYNEPGNSAKGDASIQLLKQVFKWARAVSPSQPLTAGLWAWDLKELNAFQSTHSDIITYHDYREVPEHLSVIEMLQATGRPLICTEYMARTKGSRFNNILPLLKVENVGAINWGFVNGKSNTIFAWETPLADGSQPTEWFHDILHADGTPYRQEETELIKTLNEPAFKQKMKIA